MTEAREARGPVTVREAGKRGGARLLEKYGRAHFANLGRRTAVSRRAKLGEEAYLQQMREIGRVGGEATVEKYGSVHYSDMGKVGGRNLRDQRAGTDYYQEIGRQGALSPKRGSQRLGS